MHWHASHRADPLALPLADRHYSRQKPGTPQFVPPGRCLVLLNQDVTALWVTSWPFTRWVRHAWAGAWVCSFFRNESPHLSSDLIVDAVAATRWYWPDVPALGIVTFIDPAKVRSTNPGFCYRSAGWTRLRETTKGGLIVYQLLPRDMPSAEPFNGATLRLNL